MMISIIIPAYNEFLNLKETIADLDNHLSAITSQYEIIIVDDHSTDDTFQELNSWNDCRVKCIRLSRRSGSHTAIRTGLKYANGEFVLCMAADGQEDLNVLPEIVGKWENGAQIVWGLRKARQEKLTTKFFAWLFYKSLPFLFESETSNIDLARADFFGLDCKVVEALNAIPERNTSLFGLLIWMGFTQDCVEYNRKERRHGKSKWDFSRRLNLATDWILAFSGLPLKFMTFFGFFVALLGFLYAAVILWNAFHGTPVEGWTSTIIVILVLGGIQMIMVGILGEYLWRNLEESRKRPLSFIEKSTIK